MQFRYLLPLAALVGLLTLPGAEPEPLKLAGRTWLPWEAAQKVALDENKPILVVQMLGDLDEQWC